MLFEHSRDSIEILVRGIAWVVATPVHHDSLSKALVLGFLLEFMRIESFYQLVVYIFALGVGIHLHIGLLRFELGNIDCFINDFPP